MKKLSLVIILLAVLFCGNAPAKGGSFGLGVILGEPTGLSFKSWTGSNTAIDGAAAWAFVNEGAVHLHVDYLFHNFSLIKVESGKFPVYFGLGGRVKLAKETRVGVRIPLGLEYIFTGAPFDIFLEIVPLLDLIPSTEFEVNGAIGIRYFFQ
ncbi:MAG: DUF3996 domain-containing protein [candidate division WOR-3 bacterium]|nr:DUF3996 domain-containing protein [candidate division WOR-3 bacterium]